MRRKLKSCGVMMVVATLCGVVHPVDAANRFWTNAAGGSWEAPGNWSPNGSPTNTDSIFIQANGTYTVNIDDTTADTGDPNGWLTVFETRINGDGVGGTPTLLIDFTNTSKQLTLTYTGGDALQVNSGGNIVLNNGTVALAGGYIVGTGGTGTMTQAGGFLGMGAGNTIGTLGTFTQTGGIQTGTVYFVAGRMNLDGGSLHSGSSFILGQAAGQHGVLIMNGGALTNTTTFFLGNSGRGTFVISNGTFRGNNMSFGDNSGAGSGGDWNIYGGSASVGGNLTIGTAGQSTGAVLVAGGSLGVSGATTVGFSGVGTFIVSNGSYNGNSMTVGGPAGRFEIHDGTTTLTGQMSANATATGTIVSAGGTLQAASATIGSGANGLWLINGGSNVITGSMSLADSGSGSRGTIVMNGGSLTVGGTTYMPNSGRATFIISNGTFTANNVSMSDNGNGGGHWSIFGGTGSVAGTLRIGNQVNATSTVTIANSGLLELKSSMTLGLVNASPGFGALTNRDGGTLRFTGMNNPGITVNAGSTAVIQNATLEFKDASAASLSGNITKITQYGDNTLSLNHASNSPVASYTFQTNNGQNFAFLNLANGGAFLSTATTVDSGGRITGSGLVSGSVEVKDGGTLSPGNNFGILTIGNGLSMESNSVLDLEIGPSQFDQIVVLGDVSLSNTLLQLTPTASIAAGNTYVIIDNDGNGDPTLGEFLGLTNNAFIDASANGFDAFFTIQYNAGDGNNVVLFATVPEPSAVAMLVLAGLLGIRRRRE